MTRQEDEEDIECYRKFLIRCVTGKEKFSEYLGNSKFKRLSAKDNKKDIELVLIGFINNALGYD